MEQLSHLQLGLLEKGIIDLQGDVDGDMFEYVRECMMRLALKDNPPITVKITSSGGSVWSGLFIYDLIRLYPGFKTGIAIGLVRSIAAIILQACDKRESTRNSLITIHHVGRNKADLDEIEDKNEWRKIVKFLRAQQEKLYLILEKKTNKSRSAIVALCKENCDLSAQEALDFGLIDAIV